jgi:hypothetical protein
MNYINKNSGFALWIIITVVAVVLVGGGTAAYVATRAKTNVAVESSNNATTTADVSANVDAKKSLKSLLALGQSQFCTFKQTVDNSTSEGTFYVANGKVRGDVVTKTSASADMNSHMIVDGDYMYVWTDSMKQGFKMKITGEAQTQSNTQANTPDINQELDYDCKNWTVDSSKFTLPSASVVTFTEFKAGVNANVGGTVQGSATQCAACDQIPAGTNRDMCKKQLSCK